jgi:hypothetical protein
MSELSIEERKKRAAAAKARAAALLGDLSLQKFTLRTPVEYEDIKAVELVLDLGNLSGADISDAYEERNSDGGTAIIYPAIDKRCQAYVAAKAAKVPVGLIMALKAKDFDDVTTGVQNFLMA